MEFLSRTLRAARARLAWALAISSTLRLIAAAACALLICGLLRFLIQASPVDWKLALAALGVVAAGVGFIVVKRCPSLSRTAMILDRRGRTKDRFQTAFRFASPSTPMESAAVEECLHTLQRCDIRRLTPIAPRPALFGGFAPLIALLFLQWQFSLTHRPAELDPALTRLVAAQSKSPDQLATQLEQSRTTAPEMEKLIKELRETSKRMAQERQSNEEIRKAALREFSSLEALLQQMMKTPDASPEELSALAEALKKMGEEKAARDIEDGKWEDAAQQLANLAKQLGERAEKTREQLAQSMSEALDRLSENQKSEVARQMQQMAEAAAAGNDPEVQKAMQKLQKLMQELAQSQKQQNKNGQQQQQQQAEGNEPGGQSKQMPMTAEAINQMIEALERMKQQLQNGENPDQGNSMISMQMPSQPGQEGPPGMGTGDGPPSGQPGSEMDFATTETPFGQQGQRLDEQGPAKRITGMLGEGETLRELVGTAGDDSTAKRRYKEIYNAMEAEAQNTVTQETIPLGSRALIRRYFESIRPKE